MQYLNQLYFISHLLRRDRIVQRPQLRAWWPGKTFAVFCRPQWPPPPKKKWCTLGSLDLCCWFHVDSSFFAFLGMKWYEFGSMGLYFNLQFWSWRIQGCVKETSSWRLEIPHNYFHTSPLESNTREPLAWRHAFTPPKKQLTGFCTQFTRKHIHAHCCTFYTYKSYKKNDIHVIDGM